MSVLESEALDQLEIKGVHNVAYSFDKCIHNIFHITNIELKYKSSNAFVGIVIFMF